MAARLSIVRTTRKPPNFEHWYCASLYRKRAFNRMRRTVCNFVFVRLRASYLCPWNPTDEILFNMRLGPTRNHTCSSRDISLPKGRMAGRFIGKGNAYQHVERGDAREASCNCMVLTQISDSASAVSPFMLFSSLHMRLASITLYCVSSVPVSYRCRYNTVSGYGVLADSRMASAISLFLGKA